MRSSIERLADEAPVPHPDSWPARQPPFLAYDRVCKALEAEANATARAVVKMRARAFALKPRDLDAIAKGMFNLSPRDLVTSLRQIGAVMKMRRGGFGGEVLVVNLRGAMLYARYSRAKAHQIAGRAA